MKPTHDHIHVEDRQGEFTAVDYLEDNQYRRNTLPKSADWFAVSVISTWEEETAAGVPDEPAPFLSPEEAAWNTPATKRCPWCHLEHPYNFDTNQCPTRLERLRNAGDPTRVAPTGPDEPAPFTHMGEANPAPQSPQQTGLHPVDDKHPAFKHPHGQYTVNIGTYQPEYIRDWMLHHYPQQPIQVQHGYGGWDGKPEPSSALNLYATSPEDAQRIVDHFGYAHPHEQAFGVIPHGEESQIYENPHFQPIPEQGAWDFGNPDQLPLWETSEPVWEPRRQAATDPVYTHICPGCGLRAHSNGWTGFTGVTPDDNYYQRSWQCPECQADWKAPEGRPVPREQVEADVTPANA
jgi:hypothetical protein